MTAQLNKPRILRKKLGLSIREAGTLILGQSGRTAYDHWYRIENGGKMSRQTQQLIDVFFFLMLCKEKKLTGSRNALDYLIKAIKK